MESKVAVAMMIALRVNIGKPGLKMTALAVLRIRTGIQKMVLNLSYHQKVLPACIHLLLMKKMTKQHIEQNLSLTKRRKRLEGKNKMQQIKNR